MRLRDLLQWIVLLLPVSLPAQQQCALCHPREAWAQPRTPMANAMQLAPLDLLFRTHPKLIFQQNGYTYSLEAREGHVTYTVSHGAQSISLPVKWALGAGNQTWVIERNGKFYESLVSYYLSTDGLNITTGDEKLTPRNLEEAFGRELSPAEAMTCFHCHATNAIHEDRLALDGVHPGITCERCHQGAEAHSHDMMQGNRSSIPPDLGSMSSEDISNFCGQCHRTWEAVIRSRERGPVDVRFQPYRLANSRCFNGNDPRISCIACHDPHGPLSHDGSYYDAKCLECHTPEARTAHIRSCPVSSSKCVSCHMPKVQLPNGLLSFTDHQIRIVRPGEPYPN
ncbi:MAG TPA: multiheme c-type cytochrome [Pseudacidobacterium sp.]|nr:multiheme c-type cytochrome [Pseudacidobacterium sp.]